MKQKIILAPSCFHEWIHIPDRLETGYRKKMAFRLLLDQHVIVLSSNLSDLYLTYIYENAIEEMDSAEKFLANVTLYKSNEVEYAYVKDSIAKSSPVNDIMLDVAMIAGNTIIICDDETQYKSINAKNRRISIMRKDDVLLCNMDNELYRNSIVFSRDLYPREMNQFKLLIKELFYNENRIAIIDPFFMTKSSLDSFMDFFLPFIQNGTNVDVYNRHILPSGREKPIEQSKWGIFINYLEQKHICLSLHIIKEYGANKIHDRRIYLFRNKKHVAIGRGIDSITSNRFGAIIRDSHITVDDDMRWWVFFEKQYACDNISIFQLTIQQYYDWYSP